MLAHKQVPRSCKARGRSASTYSPITHSYGEVGGGEGKFTGHLAGSTQHRGKHIDPASSQVEGEDQRLSLSSDRHIFTMLRVCTCSCTHACAPPPPKKNRLGRSQVQEVENEDNKIFTPLVCLSLQELTDHIISCSQLHATHLARNTIVGKN